MRIALALGRDVGCVEPGSGFDPLVEVDIDKLREWFTKHEPRAKKDGRYITRPMGGDGRRSDANALPWFLVPVDIDELPAAEFPQLIKYFEDSKLHCFLSTTYSHRPEAPKVRVFLIADRPVKPNEHAFVFQALARRFPFKIDPCMAKPSQPVFLPACPPDALPDAFAREIPGDSLKVDLLLEAVRDEIEAETQRKAELAQGVINVARQPGGLVQFFNKNFDLDALLQHHGYKRRSRNRYTAPGSKSGRAAVVLYSDYVISFHDPAHDPLAVRNKYHQAMTLDPFSAFCKLDHADDFKKGFQAALTWARSKGYTDEGAPAAKPPPPPLRPMKNLLEIAKAARARKFIVQGILDERAVVIAAGDSNSGKTTILQYLALQIARGADFGPRRTKQGRVLWIAGEDEINAANRVLAMIEEYQIDPTPIADNFLLLDQRVAILQPESMKQLREMIEQRFGAGAEFALIVVDSKSVNWGGEDENSNSENSAFVSAVRENFVNPFNASVIITHHFTKHKEATARSSRGASSLINDADHEWYFEMNREQMRSAMRPGSKVRVEHFNAMHFQIKIVELPQAKYAHLLDTYFNTMPSVSVCEPVNAYNQSLKALAQDADERKALVALAKSAEGMNAAQVAKDTGWDPRKASRVLKEAVKQKLCTSDGKIYSITSAGRDCIATDVIEDPSPDGDE